MASQHKYGSSTIYKFLVYKISKLVKTSRGRLQYMSNLDDIFYDIFGVKHFVKKINESYDSRDIIDVLESIGSDNLMSIMNNPTLYNALRDLISIDYRIEKLKKEIKKQSKKNKRDKSLIKEYNYLTKLYKDSIKYFRKKLGIKDSKSSYKRKYKSLNNIVNRNEYDYDDDEFTSILLNGDEFDFDVYEYDDDYDDDDSYYESTSELDDFVNMMNGRNPKGRSSHKKKNQKSETRRYINQDPSDFDIDDDDDDDYDEYDSDDIEREDAIVGHLNKLTDNVTELAGVVQSLVARNEYESTQRRKQQYQNPVNVADLHPQKLQPQGQSYQTDDHREIEIITDFIGKLSEEQVKMKADQKNMARAMDHMIQNQQQIKNYLESLFDDVEDDYEEEEQEEVPYQPSRSNELIAKINRHEDVYEDTDEVEPRQLSKMTREDIIDAINNSADDSNFVDETETTVTVSEKITVESE